MGGLITVVGGGLGADGFEAGWGRGAIWSNASKYTDGSNNGNGWANVHVPGVYRSGTAVVVTSGDCNEYYDGQGSKDGNGNHVTYLPHFTADGSGITYARPARPVRRDRGAVHLLRVRDRGAGRPQGDVQVDDRAGGGVTEVTAWDAWTGRPRSSGR